MKTYKHKRKWYKASYLSWYGEYVIKDWEDQICILPVWVVEECDNREEVVEKDWIDDVIIYLKRLWWKFQMYWCEQEFRDVLEECTPKVKKFTDTDISEFAKARATNFDQEVMVRGTLELFLKKHWLYVREE